ncbi:MAG: HAMP domain-containing histidine kinase [Acidobacteria bacterium]|nr:HAMP domain-containing histidine kinase [Acidobacteriota bacterium]
MSSPVRVVLSALVIAAVLLAGGGKAWELWRFGTNDAATIQRLETEIREHIRRQADEVEALARRVVADAMPFVDATESGAELSVLFARLEVLAGPSRPGAITATVYVPDPSSGFRMLAWSDGPAGDLAPHLLAGPSTLVVVPGPVGLRLVAVRPIERQGRRVATVAAERVLTSATRDGTPMLPTAFGPITIIPTYAAGALATPNAFVIDRPLLEVHYAQADIAAARARFQSRALATAALPLVVALVVLSGPLVGRRRTGMTWSTWLIASGGAAVLVGAAALLLTAVMDRLDAPDVAVRLGRAGALAAIVGLVAGGAWWRRWPRRTPASAQRRFVAEQLFAGALLAAAIAGAWAILSGQIPPSSLAAWHSALFPFDLMGLLNVWTVLLTVLAIGWAAAAVLAIAAERWRLARSAAWSALAIGCWTLPVAALVASSPRWPTPPGPPALSMTLLFAGFAVAAPRLRRRYRHATQSSRLVLGFLALVVPLAGLYPLVASAIDRSARAVIETEYSPQAARQSDDIRSLLRKVQDELDRLPLAAQVRLTPAQPIESQSAFLIWNQTALKSTRVISDIELYGRDRSLLSRFALNFPEYVARTTTQKWPGAGCEWETFGEVTRFGSSNRTMLHAQKGLCDPEQGFVGAVVVHVAPTDYDALPFVASASPSSDLVRVGGTRAPRAGGPVGLELVVYGWSLQPIFTTDDGIAWTIDDALFRRIYGDGRPFWTTLDANRRRYHVHLQQNRAGIYALGYPAATLRDHAARLAEIAAVAALLFIIVQAAAVLYVPLVRRTRAPLRVLITEVRTSFYRKLFLFFVLVAVGPVLLFALAFSGFMQARFRDDIQGEAASVVAVARRVFEQIAVNEQSGAQPPSDDMMVWIRQVIEEDVNLFDGPALVATSQRDLFNSGLLPGRTPATVYRKIALERLPSFVTEDQQYLVAASPLPALGPGAVLSVPLAPRQREIQQEIDELNRGVLVGSVLVVLFAAGLGASLAGRIADPVARLTNATRRIAAGQLDVRIAADTADELRRLVDDFNTMTARLVAQRAELARANQLKAWNEMARQVAHEIKNPLTPIQLAAEHLQRVHGDRGRPLGETLDQCIRTVLGQVRLLRQIASEFANFASEPTSRPEAVDLGALVNGIIEPYRPGLAGNVAIDTTLTAGVIVRADRTLLVRALTNLVENALQAMPDGGALRVTVEASREVATIVIADSGVGMDEQTIAHAFEPYFSTKTGGSGLGLANAQRSIEREGGTIALASTPGQGTIVTVTLPRMAAPHDGSAPSSAPSR